MDQPFQEMLGDPQKRDLLLFCSNGRSEPFRFYLLL